MTESSATDVKTCTGCGLSKPRDRAHFNVRPDAPDGLRARCLDCANAGRRARTAERSALISAAQVRPRPPEPRPRPSPPPSPVPRSEIGEDEDTEEIDAASVARPPTILPTIEPTRAERYVITYAQNATPVHAEFLASLRVYCAENDARLVVIPGRYKNPTSIWTEGQEHDDWWAPELAEFLFAGRMRIGKLAVIGDLSIQPTAIRPLTGLEKFAADGCAVFGHTKIQLQTIAGAERYYPRILTTTGAITLPNYTKSKAGMRGQIHHTIGACIVERDPQLFHLRQIIAAPDGSFTDLDREYTPEGSRKAPRALALILGDVHVDKIDREVEAATLRRPDSIAAVLEPEMIVYHDVLDFDARNHHSIGHFPNRYARATGRENDSVEAEVMRAVEFVDATPDGSTPIVVRSNHDAAYDRWLNTADWKTDPVNARFFVQTWNAILDEYDQTGEWPDAFALLYKLRGQGRARFLKLDEPLQVGGVHLGFHGHTGLNGARGSILAYSKLGARVVIGHSHHPEILDDAVSVGVTGKLDQGYNALPSSHLNTHCAIYASGARCLLNIIRGQWRRAD